jgi:phage terminase small subunit
MSKQAFEPPRPLDPVARSVWDRQAQRLHRDGRFHSIDHDLLALFAETTSMYLALKADIDERGMLVPGRGTPLGVGGGLGLPLAAAGSQTPKLRGELA